MVRYSNCKRGVENGDWLRAAANARPAEERRGLGACPLFPRERIHCGVEYLFGTRENVNGTRENVNGGRGEANRLQAAVIFYLP